jgi:hypothetical protein
MRELTVEGLLNGTALGYGLDDGGSSPGKGWELFSSPSCPDRLRGPTNPI